MIKTASYSPRITGGVTAPLRLDKKCFTAPHGVQRGPTALLIMNPDPRGYGTLTPDLLEDGTAHLSANGRQRGSARARITSRWQ